MLDRLAQSMLDRVAQGMLDHSGGGVAQFGSLGISGRKVSRWNFPKFNVTRECKKTIQSTKTEFTVKSLM